VHDVRVDADVRLFGVEGTDDALDRRMELSIRAVTGPPLALQEIEIVERKGLGHPDTICDAIADHVCRRLCRHYLERFGRVLHHNVDKVLLCGGAARPSFGGGEVIEPIEIHLAGRATDRCDGERIPTSEIAVEACRGWLAQNLPRLDARHVRIVSHVRPGSADLTSLFARAGATPLANDTSSGAGFAPLTDLERVVLTVERALSSKETHARAPAIGEDVKVMGVRRGSRIDLTIGCAFVDRHVRDVADYVAKKEEARAIALEAARRETAHAVDAEVNAADDVARGEVFLTVTGTSAEAGDDGEVGRGNRTTGLITPYRPMTLEAAAGKNPVTHVGKIYNVVAPRIAKGIADLAGVLEATCILSSRIGRPVSDPAIVDVRIVALEPLMTSQRAAIRAIVEAELGRLDALRDALVRGEVAVY
jgi:S-adenosylmethionine synthetase